MIIAIASTIIFGIIAVLLSIEGDRKKKLFLKEKELQENKIKKLAILKNIKDKISYSLDIQKAIDIVMENLRSLFPYSTASCMVLKDKNIILKAFVEESISTSYLKAVKESMLLSIRELRDSIPTKIDERVYGVSLNDQNAQTFFSSFHIPLVVNNNVVALIHLTSTKHDLYKNKEMEILYQILEDVGNALSRFQKAIDSEKDIFISLINGMNEGIFLADTKNNLLIANNALKNMLSIDKEDITSLDVANTFPVKFDFLSKLDDVISKKRPVYEKDVKIKEKIVDLFMNLLDSDRVLVVLYDVTELNKTTHQREEIMHIMVHELRAPITTIKDASELIISTHNTLDEDKKLKFLEIIHSQSKIILDQVGSILDTAKLDAGRFTIQKMEGDFSKVLKDEVDAFMPQAERKQISLSFQIINPLPLIYFDVLRISQVINNLISNSLKFTPEKGFVKIEVDYKPVPPNLNAPTDKDKFLSLEKYIIVTVCDNGIGIAKEQQKYLFSKFTQAHNAPEKLTNLGSGLGLYLVKGIIEAHGGRVWVKSEPGLGTTITFPLPVHTASEEKQTSSSTPTFTGIVN